MSENVVEVTDATFEREVLEESFRRPVVVDFWAEWCQPCRMIGPVLERLAGESGGQFVLAKLDVDANPEASAAFRIQSIPAVYAFVDGKVVNQFLGAVPEQSIRAFLETVLPSKADRLAAAGDEAERSGRTEQAEDLYRQALEADAHHRAAALGLGRLAAERRDTDRAREFLLPLRPDPEAERLLAALEVSAWATAGPETDGPLAQAERAAGEGRFQEALDVFLAAVRNGREEDREAARDAMLKVFAVLGDDHPLTAEYRQRLSAALF